MISELTRHDAAVFVRHALSQLAPAQGATWQVREAAVFSAAASIEALLSRVLSPPGMPPPPAAKELSALLGQLLGAVVTMELNGLSAGRTIQPSPTALDLVRRRSA